MVTDTLRRFFCGLHGHDALLHFEHGRMSMRCTSCGYETPGWDLRVGAASPASNARDGDGVLPLPLVRGKGVA